MAKYKEYSYDQTLMIPVSFKKQILPGTFENTLCHLIDHQVDLSIFANKYENDFSGAPAYDPAILLKNILYAYSKGINSSRKIAQLCQENIVCMALAADAKPHFTTIADFISTRHSECTSLFTMIISVCYSQGLIGKNMFAIDGCKISSNCSKEWSGTKQELLAKTKKIERSVKYLVEKHESTDRQWDDQEQRQKEEQSIRRLQAGIWGLEWKEVYCDKSRIRVDISDSYRKLIDMESLKLRCEKYNEN